MRPDVSILTCTYDRPEMLAECLASVLAQTCISWEHLVFDNGSTDPRVRTLLALAEAMDGRVRVFQSARNVDQPARRWNDLIERAGGRAVCFLDDDCTKDPNFLEVLLGVLDKDPAVDAVTCGFRELLEDGTVRENHLNLRTAEEIASRNTVDTGGFLIRASALARVGYFPLDVRTSEDWALVRRMASCLNMCHLSDCLASWREHGGQRLRLARELGGERDKLRIFRAGPWKDPIGVRMYLPSASYGFAESIATAICDIPWTTEGEDLAIEIASVVGPFGPQASALSASSAAGTVLVVHWQDPLNLHANLDRLRSLAARREDVWAATNDVESARSYREILGERVVVCDVGGGFEDLPRHVERVVNAVMSRRFEAVSSSFSSRAAAWMS